MEYWAFRAGIAVGGAIPEKMTPKVASIVRLVAPLAGPYWRLSMNNLRRAYGPMHDDSQLRGISRKSFANLALSALEMARIWSNPGKQDDTRIAINGLHHFRNAEKMKKGIIMMTGHLGNWELAGACFARLVHPLAAIARVQSNMAINNIIMGSRQRAGIKIIPKQCPWMVVRSFLSDHYAIGFLADQHGGCSGVPVSFFGIRTTAPKGVVLTSLRTGAPVLPAFLLRDSNALTHTLHIEPAINLQRTGNLQRDLHCNTQMMMNILETYIRKWPEQWLWMHRRWKRSTRHAVRIEQ